MISTLFEQTGLLMTLTYLCSSVTLLLVTSCGFWQDFSELIQTTWYWLMADTFGISYSWQKTHKYLYVVIIIHKYYLNTCNLCIYIYHYILYSNNYIYLISTPKIYIYPLIHKSSMFNVHITVIRNMLSRITIMGCVWKES